MSNLDDIPRYECPYCMQDIQLRPTEDEDVFEISYHSPHSVLMSICRGSLINIKPSNEKEKESWHNALRFWISTRYKELGF